MSDDIPLTRAAMTTDEHGRRICPSCGRAAIDEKRLTRDEELCTPARCPAWVTEAVFDHETRQWVPTGPDWSPR